MNWRRVFLHVFIFLVTTYISGVQFGSIESSLKARGLEVPWHIKFMDNISAPIIAIFVFARLATIQQEKLYKHAWAVGICAWLLSLPFNVWIAGVDIFACLLQFIVIAICLIIGVAIGTGIHRRKSRVEDAV